MDTFNTYNAYTCLVMGLSSNLTLAWLILKGTKDEMKHYSTILLHSIVVNIVYLVVSAIVQPYTLLENGNLLMVQTGFSQHSSRIVNALLAFLWFFIFSIKIYSLSSQFVYRYLILCRKIEVTSRLLAVILLIPNIFCVIFIIMIILENEAFDGHDALIESLFHINATKHSFGFFVRKSSVIKFYSDTFMLATLALIYGIIAWCSYKLRKTFKMASQFISRSTVHELNSQISVALVVQAILPLGMVFIVVVYMGYAKISKAPQSSSAITLVAILFHWVPVINPLCTLLIVKRYRKQIVSLFKCHQESPSIAVSKATTVVVKR
ncbi:serpentine type 7TM GPCR chemoreceptor srd domain-containing protein [Ditylenchus destructor]|uniref:Serpentine type 7TM GPCR chemoreceptor srd domain-containing protein n=1 Tax=Ditylenchus destructor TaxID=166010 RepID=A0AAD4MGQ6_9BILA|nr:serpentine type 7TM GPCR chemoreceptor srd domain-containing protein [Ditylenchus destructor]